MQTTSIRSLAMQAAPGATPPERLEVLRSGLPPQAIGVSDQTGQRWPYMSRRRPDTTASFWADMAAVAEDALNAADLSDHARATLPVLLGSTCLDMPDHEAALHSQPQAPALMNAHCGRTLDQLATELGLGGPQFTLSTACSSAANALLHARRLLVAGRAEHVLVIGTEFYNRLTLSGFASLLLLSPDTFRPFDADREGLILGEAVGAMVLSRQPRDRRDLGRLLGGATGCDPSSPTNSSPEFLVRIMQQALDDAGLTTDDLLAIKAHGTGTPSNDAAEGAALDRLFGNRHPVTSLKPYFGHTLGACGLVELAGLLEAWSAGFLPATPGFRTLGSGEQMTPITQPHPLPAEGAVLCNSFGFGGNTTSLVVAR